MKKEELTIGKIYDIKYAIARSETLNELWDACDRYGIVHGVGIWVGTGTFYYRFIFNGLVRQYTAYDDSPRVLLNGCKCNIEAILDDIVENLRNEEKEEMKKVESTSMMLKANGRDVLVYSTRSCACVDYDKFYIPKPTVKYPRITNIKFNGPATIVFWSDGDKTIVKCGEGDVMDYEKGIALATMKKFLGTNKSKSNFNDILKQWVPDTSHFEMDLKENWITTKEYSEKTGMPLKKVQELCKHEYECNKPGVKIKNGNYLIAWTDVKKTDKEME